MMRWYPVTGLFFYLTMLLSPLQATAQDKGAIPMLNAKLGLGVPYGGLGLNLEYGYDRISIFLVKGWAWGRQATDEVRIDPTFNYGLGVRYHFRLRNEFLTPRVGLEMGWVTNYYNSKIEDRRYDQSVYGLSVQGGLEFLTEAGVLVNLDLAVTPDFAILTQDEHPFFFSWYIRPAIGIGYDFSALLYGEKRQKKRKKRQNFNFDQ
ncbi:MAG: hypothetical protein AAGB22_04395 [Bacteroidota bacterium]